MRTSIIPAETDRTAPPHALVRGPLNRLAKRMVMALLEDVDIGELLLEDNGERLAFGKASEDFPLRAVVTIHHPRFYRRALWGGSIGAAEAYMAGDWSADDLTMVIRIMVLNRHIFEKMDSGWGRFMEPIHQWFHWLNKNTRAGSRANIVAHYDLGNDFYQLFLDDTMTYSCGIFETEASTLREASVAKYDRICLKLDLQSSDHVLEIGTGWGGFAMHAAQHYGCRVTTTTISPAQFEWAKEYIDGEGLGDRVTLLLKDYRDLEGLYDKVVSIEMIEAVGHQFLETFFQCCSRLLKRDGMMLLQAITIADAVYDQHKRSVDFVKRYIFPGSCIPSLTAMCLAVARSTDLRVVHLEDLTPHYAKTLRAWRQRFFENIEQVRALGYSDTFIRLWEYYLCYCEGGFEERYLGNVQMLMAKPFCRSTPILPELPPSSGKST
ncbi:MAG: cyclopropane-fatty-acyl-phospholipid synthase family protein [Thermodesulfobacteriota bacterium]|nr:cyclopropane-fatty-acyl-phospholipid synthase family protein [Thermodesulfobacteriota bacterium]